MLSGWQKVPLWSSSIYNFCSSHLKTKDKGRTGLIRMLGSCLTQSQWGMIWWRCHSGSKRKRNRGSNSATFFPLTELEIKIASFTLQQIKSATDILNFQTKTWSWRIWTCLPGLLR